MENLIHVAALDLGTSKIAGMIASKTEDGILSILASEQISSENCIRRGYVFNVEETTLKVSQLVSRLNRKLESPIEKIYVGIGGQSIRTAPHTVQKSVPGGIVTQDILDSLTEEAEDFVLASLDTLTVVSPEYYLDGQLEANPKGATASVIEARFHLIVGRPSLKKTLFPIIEFKANLDNAGFLVSPLATAEAVLTEREKELGCALVEFGAGLTYVSVYKGKLLRYLVTIPLGGDVITKDICSLNMLEPEAEDLKIKSGSALTDLDNDDPVNDVIEARADEILENVIKQIEASGFAQSLGAGIIITGGAAQLKNLKESLRKKTNKEVRLASTKRSLVNQAATLSQDPANSSLIGLLSMGTEECLKAKEIPVVEIGETDLFGQPLNQPEDKNKGKGKRKEKGEGEGKNFFKQFGKKMGEISNTLSTSLFSEEAEDTEETTKK